MGNPFSLDEFYDRCPQIEEEFQTELDDSLNPRSPDFLFQLVGDLPLHMRHAPWTWVAGRGKTHCALQKGSTFAQRALTPLSDTSRSRTMRW